MAAKSGGVLRMYFGGLETAFVGGLRGPALGLGGTDGRAFVNSSSTICREPSPWSWADEFSFALLVGQVVRALPTRDMERIRSIFLFITRITES